MIKCGSGILLENGTLYFCGRNYYGQLGLKDNKDREIFQKVPFDKKIIQISAGFHHTFVLTENFQIYSCGWNDYGQLGLNDKTDRNELEWISSLNGKKIIRIECGYFHSCALTGKLPNMEIIMISKDDGFVYSWGVNNMGQLGLGDLNNRITPTLIGGLTKIKKIYCGDQHTMATNENDELYVWGWNRDGQLGLGDLRERLRPTLHSFFKNKKILNMACGFGHCIALLANGEIYSWGDNYYGQPGHGDVEIKCTPTLISFFEGMNVLDIFTFSKRSFVLLENYDIYAFGKNEFGQLALNDKADRRTPEKIKCFQNEKIINISGRVLHTFFISGNDKIYGVGNNRYGQIGIGYTDEIYDPILIKFEN